MANRGRKVNDDLREHIRRNWKSQSDMELVRSYDGNALADVQGFYGQWRKVQEVRVRMGLKRPLRYLSPEQRFIRAENRKWAANAKIEARALEKIRKAGFDV